jgi:outer membrane cobalamin receptor
MNNGRIPVAFISLVMILCTIHCTQSGGQGADADMSVYYAKSEVQTLLQDYVKYNSGTNNMTTTGSITAGNFSISELARILYIQ